jgi:hypothetical protein
MQYGSRQNSFFWIIGPTILFFGLALPAARAQPESMADWRAKEKAGEYAEPAKSDKRLSFGMLSQTLRNGNFADGNDLQLFTDLYEKRYFPLVTHPEVRGTKEDPVVVLRASFKSALPGSPVADKLTEIALAYMQPITTDAKQHPAARVNAILAIGEVKSPKAVDALMQLVQDRKLHPVFKIAAAAGLAHLAEQGVLADPAVAAPVVTLMEKYAATTRPNPSDGLRWARGQAADVLGAIGSVGADGKVPDALLSMVADKELPLMQRGKAARALGRLKYVNGLPNSDAYIKAFASFGSDALADNLPGDSRRIGAVSRDFVDGLEPLKAASPTPKAVTDMYNAMKKLRDAASKMKQGITPRPPSEEDLKPDVAAAKGVLDAAAQANK